MSTVFSARAGDTFPQPLLLRQANGEPVNLTGASVEWRLESHLGASVYRDEARASITNPTDGEITLLLTPAQTRALAPAGTWASQVVTEDAAGVRVTRVAGTLEIGSEVAAGAVP